MSESDSPPATPIDDPPPPDFDQREVLEQLVKDNYRRLTNRINIRDFLPRLREKGFSLSDQQEVQHEITTVDKAGKLIDLVMRKDTSCLKVFLEVLEYDYEDLYWRMTGVKARERPESWRQIERPESRRSMQALTGIMETMSGILTELTKNHNTMQNLASQVHGVWTKTSQEQINEEQQMVKVKDTLDKLKAENVTFMWENKVLKSRLELERKKTEKLSSADERLLQLRKEMRDKDALLQQMELNVDNRAGQIEDHRLKTLIDQNKEMERELQNEQNENKQMQRDLVESEKELKVLKERVDDLSEENLSLRTKLDELETHCYWLERKERRQQSMEYPIYDQSSVKRGREKKIEEEPESDGHYSTVAPKCVILRQPSVGATTNIANNLCRLSRKLSAVNMLLSEDCMENYRQEKLDISDLVQNDFISHDPMRGSISTAELAGTDILNVISLAGGNHCGIFVSSVNSAGQAVANKIKVGDNIMKIQPVGAGDNSAICLGDCTLEDAYSVLQKQTERVQMFFWSGGEMYKKFLRRENTTYRGDLFCVQVKTHTMSLDVEGKPEIKHPLEYGDILLVLDTMRGEESARKWFVRKLEPHFGKWQLPKIAGLVPSQKTEQGLRSTKLSKTRGHRVTVEQKPKSLYTYVKPCVPQYARPVLLFGESHAIPHVLDVASGDHQFKLEMKETVESEGTSAEKLMSQITLFDTKHMIVEGNHKLLKDLMKRKVYPIVVRVKSDCGSSIVEDPLKHSNLPKSFIEELELTEKTLTVKEEILRLLKFIVTQAQRHLIWMEGKQPMLPIR